MTELTLAASPGDETSSMDRKRGRVFFWLTILVFLAYLVQVAFRVGHDHLGDFYHFYWAGQAMLEHRDLYTSGTGGYLYPPLIALIYSAVGRLEIHHAALVMLPFNVLCGLAGVLLLAPEFVRRLGTSRSAAVVYGSAFLGTMLNVDKIHMEFQMFQTNAIMFLMFVLGLKWLDKRPWLAGLPLGFILNIKYLSLAMLPWLILRRRWSTAIAFVVGSVAFALLPASVSGWQENLHNQGVAYSGLLHMVGIGSAEQQANVESITAGFSCSITSAMARLTLLGLSMPMAVSYAAVTALISFAVVTMIYRRQMFPLWCWPGAVQQKRQPWLAIIGIEYSSIVAATLCFSPQTNTKHLFLALLITIPSAVLILQAKSRLARFGVGVGVVTMFLAFVLPPGNRFSNAHHLSLMWLYVGGLCWGLLLAMLTLVSYGFQQADALARESDRTSC